MLEWVEHERVFSSLKKQGIIQQQDISNHPVFFDMQTIDSIDLDQLNDVHSQIFILYTYSLKVLQKIDYSGQLSANKKIMKDKLMQLLLNTFNILFQNPYFVIDNISKLSEKLYEKSAVLRKPRVISIEEKIKSSIEILNTVSAAVFEILLYIRDEYKAFNPKPFSLKKISYEPCGIVPTLTIKSKK